MEISDSDGPRTSDVRPRVDPSRWLDDHGDILYRYALARVHKPEVAEDIVQETLLSAMHARDRFAGKSSERSWLIGILKNKVVDHFRRTGRETSFTDLAFYSEEEARRFDRSDYWIHELGPKDWGPQAEEVEFREEFWQTFGDCMAKLPHRVADVFRLREIDELTTDEICEALAISPNNLWVMLHRARMALRQCLELNWFQKTESR